MDVLRFAYEELPHAVSVVASVLEVLRPRVPRLRARRLAEAADEVPHLRGVGAAAAQKRGARGTAHGLVAVGAVEREGARAERVRVRRVRLRPHVPGAVDQAQVVEDDEEHVARAGGRGGGRRGRGRGAHLSAALLVARFLLLRLPLAVGAQPALPEVLAARGTTGGGARRPVVGSARAVGGARLLAVGGRPVRSRLGAEGLVHLLAVVRLAVHRAELHDVPREGRRRLGGGHSDERENLQHLGCGGWGCTTRRLGANLWRSWFFER